MKYDSTNQKKTKYGKAGLFIGHSWDKKHRRLLSPFILLQERYSKCYNYTYGKVMHASSVLKWFSNVCTESSMTEGPV